jgi:hypothetical protein
VTQHDQTAIVERLAQELRRLGPMELVLRPPQVFYLAGLIQLALRHPSVQDTSRDIGERFLIGVRAYFAESPTCLDLVQRGDDPAADQPLPD